MLFKTFDLVCCMIVLRYMLHATRIHHFNSAIPYISFNLQDVVVAAYTLYIIGMIVSAVKVSNNWWDPWRSFLVCSAALLLTLWGTPTVKDALVKKYATKHTPASDKSGVITELLVAMLP